MQRRIFALLLSLVSILILFHSLTLAEEPSVVYTEFVSGNDSHTGNGTIESPYNLFEDALEAVADGGTIYIGENGAFVNVSTNGDPPLKITKNVTITGAPNIAFRPALEMRKGGLVLGANVKFSNIVLSFPNANHAAVYANGYTLVLDNVSYSQSANVIQLAGGSLYNISGQSLSPASGDHSRIVISGKDTLFGNIYAGSINGIFAGDVDIEISGIPGSSVGNIYSCGAKEGYYNSDNFLDPYNAPDAPVANPSVYPVTGNVSIDLNDSSIRSIEGKTGGADNASLTVSSKYRHENDLSNIGNITVKSGTFAPRTVNDDVNVNIQAEGILDMSSISNCAVNNFYCDDGILILNKNGCLTVNGSCRGSAELRTPAGSRDTSGIAVYDHMYIKTAGDAEFTFNPYSTQTDMTLNKTKDGWRTSVQPEYTEKVVLKNFDIVSPVIVTSKSQINGYAGANTVVEFNAEFTEDTTDEDLSMIPFEYAVTYNGKNYAPVKSIEYCGTYIGVIPELYLNFVPGPILINGEDAQGMMIVNWSDVFEKSGDIPEGIYDIEITAPTESGDVTRSMRMTVTEDRTEGVAATHTGIRLSSENISYNDCVNVYADIKSEGYAVTQGSTELYINGKPYSAVAVDEDGAALWQNIPVTIENGFQIGLNQFEVWYNGSETYAVSRSEAKSLTVDKATVVINHGGKDTAVNYTGSSMDIDFGEFSFTGGNGRDLEIEDIPEVSYTDKQGNTLNPIMPGIYTAELNLPGGDYYAPVNQSGPTLTINPAVPSVILNISDKDERGITLTAEVDVQLGGRIPTGSINIIDKADGTVKGTVSLSGGSAEIELTNQEYGEHTFYAVYTPDTHAPYTSSNSSDIIVTFEKPIEKTTWAVNGIGTDSIEVTFTNLTEKDINNAVMILAAYDENGILRKIEQAEQSVNASIESRQEFSFDLSGVSYERIKIFIWNSLAEMESVCENYQ